MKREDTWLDLEPEGFSPSWLTADRIDEFCRRLRALGIAETTIEARGRELLDLAGRRFADADGWYDWPDIELWRVLREAHEKIEWLLALLSGSTAPQTTSTSHDLERGTAATLRRRYAPYPKLKDRLEEEIAESPNPLRSPARLVRAVRLAIAESSEDGVDSVAATLREMCAAIEKAQNAIAPPRRALSDEEAREWRDAFVKAGLFDETEAFELPEPDEFLGGRLGPAPALVDLVAEAALFWRQETGRLPAARATATTDDREQFLELLLALARSHDRRLDEMSEAVVTSGIRQARMRASRP